MLSLRLGAKIANEMVKKAWLVSQRSFADEPYPRCRPPFPGGNCPPIVACDRLLKTPKENFCVPRRHLGSLAIKALRDGCGLCCHTGLIGQPRHHRATQIGENVTQRHRCTIPVSTFRRTRSSSSVLGVAMRKRRSILRFDARASSVSSLLTGLFSAYPLTPSILRWLSLSILANDGACCTSALNVAIARSVDSSQLDPMPFFILKAI